MGSWLHLQNLVQKMAKIFEAAGRPECVLEPDRYPLFLQRRFVDEEFDLDLTYVRFLPPTVGPRHSLTVGIQ